MKFLTNTKKQRFLTSLMLVLFYIAASSPGWAEGDQMEDTNVIARYSIESNMLTADAEFFINQKSGQQHQIIWNYLTDMIPGNLLSQISSFEIFTVSSDSDFFTDGYTFLSADGNSFVLGLNYQSAYNGIIIKDPEERKNLVHTIIHEFAHVLSLNQSQMNNADSVTETMKIEEGKLSAGSYLNVFYGKFWKNKYAGHDVDTLTDEEGLQLFSKNKLDFVTEYAATGPVEDFAESFTYFVKKGMPPGNDLRSEKIKFFYDYPELAEMRAMFRKGL